MNVPCLTSCGWWEAHGILSKWFSGLRYGLYWTWPEAGSINSCMSRNGVDHSDADHVNSTPSYLALSATMRTASSAVSAYTRARQSSMNLPKNAMRGSSCGLSIDSKSAPYRPRHVRETCNTHPTPSNHPVRDLSQTHFSRGFHF